MYIYDFFGGSEIDDKTKWEKKLNKKENDIQLDDTNGLPQNFFLLRFSFSKNPNPFSFECSYYNYLSNKVDYQTKQWQRSTWNKLEGFILLLFVPALEMKNVFQYERVAREGMSVFNFNNFSAYFHSVISGI